jgi:hypothetical protein
MNTVKKMLTQGALAALLATGATVAMTDSASARVACNREGECWHVRGDYNYRPEFGLTVHDDGWRWGRHDHYRWHEHNGHGYWRNGIWIRL